MDKNTKLTISEFIELFNSESEFWDICYLDDDFNLQLRSEVEIN